MRHIVDPQQNRLFDPYHGLFPPQAINMLKSGWQAPFRAVLLELMPVRQMASHFHETMGAPTKELHAMAGLVFLADFLGWTAFETAEAYMFRTDVQFVLNVEPGAEISERTIQRYQKLFQDDNLAQEVFQNVTGKLTELLDLDISRQRLDSTHVLSHMANFGRTKLMAVANKRFLTQLKRYAPGDYDLLPEDFRNRYEPSQARLFSGACDAEARNLARQQVADDLLLLIERFADTPAVSNRSTYKMLVRIFGEQCEIVEGAVQVRKKTGGNRIQNPSDPDATYDGHKGSGYQTQIAETCSDDNEVQLITAVLPQTACEYDGDALQPILDQLQETDRLPEALLADGHYASDGNVQLAAKYDVELVGPLAGRPPTEAVPESLSIDDFAIDERTNEVECCPAGHVPESVEYHTTQDDEGHVTGSLTVVHMAPEVCQGCSFFKHCPVKTNRQQEMTVEFTDEQMRRESRRREQDTPAYKERYARRSGIESTNSGLKNRLGLGQLPVRGKGAVFRKIIHKVAGWNVLRAAATEKLRELISNKVDKLLFGSGTAQSGQLLAWILPFHRPWETDLQIRRPSTCLCANCGAA